MQVSALSYNVSFLPLENLDYRDDIFSVTNDELKFIAFAGSRIRGNQGRFLFLGSSGRMGSDFKLWQKYHKIPICERGLDAIITSLWQKSQIHIEHVIFEQSPGNLANEIVEQNVGVAIKSRRFEKHAGKVFTPKQVELLIAVLNEIAELASIDCS